MKFDATFWVAISFIIFFGGIIYLKIPQKIIELLDKMIGDIKNESKKILDQAKKDSENLVIELNNKFHKSAEIKKNSATTKISQMKDSAIKEITNTSIRLTIDSVKKIISTSVDKSKLDNLFEKNLEETKSELRKINS